MQLQGGTVIKMDDNIKKSVRVILWPVLLRQMETPLILNEGVWQHVRMTSPSQTILKKSDSLTIFIINKMRNGKTFCLNICILRLKANRGHPVFLPCHYCCCCWQWTPGWGSAWDCSSLPVWMFTARHKTLLTGGGSLVLMDNTSNCHWITRLLNHVSIKF